MNTHWKNVIVAVQEPDYAADEMFGEPGMNFCTIGKMEFPTYVNNWDFNSEAIFYSLLAHSFLDEEDWDLSEIKIEDCSDIDWIFVRSVTTSEVLFRLQIIS